MVKKKKSEFEGELTALSLPERNPETPKSSYAPEGFKTADEYLEDMRETYSADLEADNDNREAAMEDKKFTAGEQWDPEVLRERQGLPCLTVNTIPQFTAQLVGDWRLNKVGIKVLPSENGDREVADIRADLIRSIETQSRAPRVYNSAFESMVQCGDGAFRVGVQYAGEDVFDQEIVIQPIDDALSVVWDRLSVDPTGRDANHCFVDDMLPEKEFKARWPECDPSLLRDEDKRMYSAEGWIDSKTVRVTEHWRLIERERTLVLFEDGSIFALEGEVIEPEAVMAYIQRHGKPVRTRHAPCLYAQMHLVTGWKILAGPYEWKMNRLPIIRMAGRVVSVGERRVRYGLVRYMKDAARLRNFWRSVAAEQLGYAPKAKWIATESAVEGREDTFREAHKSRDPLLIVNDETVIGQDIQPVPPPSIESALLNEAQVNTQDMKDVTGIHDASLGIKSNETSGKAIQARQREGDVASLTYYDNGNAAVLEAGDVINQLIGQIYDATRIVRVIGEDESSKLMKINDPHDPRSPNIATGKYDVAITTGASYTTKRVEAAEAMMNAIQVYPELMSIAGDLVIKAQDWPGAEDLSKRLLKTIPPQLLSEKEQGELGAGAPDMQAIAQQQAMAQEQMAQAMQELQKLQQENLLLKTKEAIEEKKLAIEAKKLEIEQFEAETNRIEAYGAMAKYRQDAEIQAMELNAHEHERAHTEKMDIADRMHSAVKDDADRSERVQERQQTSAEKAADRERDSAERAEDRKAKAVEAKAKTKPSSDKKS